MEERRNCKAASHLYELRGRVRFPTGGTVRDPSVSQTAEKGEIPSPTVKDRRVRSPDERRWRVFRVHFAL